jgi:hypothetical protein
LLNNDNKEHPMHAYAQFVFDANLKIADAHRPQRARRDVHLFSSGNGMNTPDSSQSQSNSVRSSQWVQLESVGPSRANAPLQSDPVRPSHQSGQSRPVGPSHANAPRQSGPVRASHQSGPVRPSQVQPDRRRIWQ